LRAAGRGRAGRTGSGGDIARCERALEQIFQICALTVLHVIDVPSARRRVLDLGGKSEESSCRVDVARLRRDHENSVDPIHRDDADDARERAFVLRLQHPLEFACPFRRVTVADRENSVGLARQDVDVESPDKTNQGLPDRTVP
jgi:hypothetical protein